MTTLAQYARDQIAEGVDPSTVIQWAEKGGLTHSATLEVLASHADMADALDQAFETVRKRLAEHFPQPQASASRIGGKQ